MTVGRPDIRELSIRVYTNYIHLSLLLHLPG